VLTHRNLVAATEAVRIAWRWIPDDRLIHCLPVFHAHGLCVGVYGTLLAGASALLLPAFEPTGVADAARSPGASMFFGVPTMYHRLAASARLSELGRLRLCVSGSAPLPAPLHQQIAARATTRSARIPSTSNAAPNDAIRRSSRSGNTTSPTAARATAIRCPPTRCSRTAPRPRRRYARATDR